MLGGMEESILRQEYAEQGPRSDEVVPIRQADSLVFLDWDDTIFPTSEIFTKWNVPLSFFLWDGVLLETWQTIFLERWVAQLYKYLDCVCHCAYKCIILTNSQRPWVAQCIHRFAPSIYPLFQYYADKLFIVYAQEYVPVQCIQEICLTQGKFEAMRREIAHYCSLEGMHRRKNVISVGDSIYEEDAIKWAGKAIKDVLTLAEVKYTLQLKTVRTPHSPSVAGIANMLEQMRTFWSTFVYFDGDFAMYIGSQV
jgi:hypothetical protein